MNMKQTFVKRVALLTLVMMGLGLATGVGVMTTAAQEGNAPEGNEVVAQEQHEEDEGVRWDVAVAITAAISIPCLAAGYAVGKVGAAALGAASENPELLGRSLIFVALGEGIAIFGFVLGLLLWTKI
jgi:V/A-type H+-transporting ATPase subunit K